MPCGVQVLAFAKQSCHSADADVRHGGLITLAAIAEGCAEALRRKVAEALPLVLRGLQVSAARVPAKVLQTQDECSPPLSEIEAAADFLWNRTYRARHCAAMLNAQ